MKKTLVLALTVLGFAPFVWAGQRHRHVPVGQHPVQLAHELDNAAERAYRTAVRHVHHGRYREARALDALRLLAVHADRFHFTLERFALREPWRVEREFRALQRSYGHAERAVYRLHGHRRLHERFARVTRLVDQLERQGWHQRVRRHRYEDDDSYDDDHGRVRFYGPRIAVDWRW